jgi:uncharacterized protein with HEPN domain
MADRAIWRLHDMKRCVVEIATLLRGKSFEDVLREPVTRVAFERFPEILSEASRHVPEEWKAEHGPRIPWRRVADLGNHIRHAYHRLDARVLWSVYEDDLGALELAIDEMLAAYASDQPPSATS